MIKGFRCEETAKVFERRHSKRFAGIQRAALRKLLMLDAAGLLDDLRVPPANRLEKLSGDRRGQHSIRINDQWRICFRWREGHAHDVEIVDYH
jgi:proteic killer suppression protein